MIREKIYDLRIIVFLMIQDPDHFHHDTDFLRITVKILIYILCVESETGDGD